MPSNRPCGVTTIHSPPSSSEISVNKCSPVLVSQRNVLPSSLAEASRRPSGVKSSDSIPEVCPASVRNSLRVATSQILIVLSVPPRSDHFAVATKDHVANAATVSFDRSDLATTGHVPQSAPGPPFRL